jgi:Domain of unknown function (DUF397)
VLDGGAVNESDYYVSSFSGGGDCVAVAKLPDGDYALRHSRSSDPPIVFSRSEWKAFVAGVKESEFDF